ncbi:MAG TPA: GNAT family N-acetyltransferase [Planctomycetaceae bacterium]|jgi:GNAT superfamily N-acetyltransferase|nr:GNAT family N-acetyltransferase [Planctomycetaceae bacterium]
MLYLNGPLAICVMQLDIRTEPVTPESLREHARISIAFQVDHVFDVTVRHNGPGEFALTERPLAQPYLKDYDALPDNGPENWAHRFDVTKWCLLTATCGDRRVGGAVLAFETDDIHMLEGRRDLTVLWDLRVAPDMRRSGVGSALFSAAENWAQSHGCRQLKVETQNVNVAACDFYASRGCRLGAIHRFAYSDLPHEVQLLWYKDLTDTPAIG